MRKVRVGANASWAGILPHPILLVNSLMRTVAIPDYRSTPGNKGAYALRRIEGDTAHFLMVTFWESEEAIRAFAAAVHLGR
jgi:hypothetical protein